MARVERPGLFFRYRSKKRGDPQGSPLLCQLFQVFRDLELGEQITLDQSETMMVQIRALTDPFLGVFDIHSPSRELGFKLLDEKFLSDGQLMTIAVTSCVGRRKLTKVVLELDTRLTVIGVRKPCDALSHIVGATQIGEFGIGKLDMPFMALIIFQDIAVAGLTFVQILDFVVLPVDFLMLFDLKPDDLETSQLRTGHGAVARTEARGVDATIRDDEKGDGFAKHRSDVVGVVDGKLSVGGNPTGSRQRLCQ